MKKLLSTITTLVLIHMIPALFFGYLHNNDTSKPATNKASDEIVTGKPETTFTPGLMFIVQ